MQKLRSWVHCESALSQRDAEQHVLSPVDLLGLKALLASGEPDFSGLHEAECPSRLDLQLLHRRSTTEADSKTPDENDL